MNKDILMQEFNKTVPMEKRSRKILILILSFALLVRLIGLFILHNIRNNFADTADYINIANNLAAGRGFMISLPSSSDAANKEIQLRKDLHSDLSDKIIGKDYYYGICKTDTPFAFWDPLWIHIIALFIWLGDKSLYILNIVNIMIAAAACILLYMLGKNLFGEVAGLIAAAIMTVDICFIFYSGVLMSDSLANFLLCLVFLWSWKIYRFDDRKKYFGLGVVMGLLFLTRAFYLIAIFILLGHIVFQLRGKYRLKAAFTVLGFLMVCSPWWVRNVRVLGNPVFLPTRGAFNFWSSMASLNGIKDHWKLDLRRNPQGAITFIERRLKYTDAIYINSSVGGGELERSRELRWRTINFIKANPHFALSHYFYRLKSFFIVETDLGSRTGRGLMQMQYLAILIFGSAGLIIALKKDKSILTFIIYFAAVLFISPLFQTGYRFRMPVIFIFMLGAGVFIEWIYGKAVKQ